MYIQNTSGTWESEVIEDRWVEGCQLRVKDDVPHLMYLIPGPFSDSGDNFIYATNSTGSWVKTIVGHPVFLFSFAIGSDENIHAAYSGYELRYMRFPLGYPD